MARIVKFTAELSRVQVGMMAEGSVRHRWWAHGSQGDASCVVGRAGESIDYGNSVTVRLRMDQTLLLHPELSLPETL